MRFSNLQKLFMLLYYNHIINQRYFGFVYDNALRFKETLIKRACQRGAGSERQMKPITPEHMKKFADLIAAPKDLVLYGNLVTLGVTFLLRADEMLSLTGMCTKRNCRCRYNVCCYSTNFRNYHNSLNSKVRTEINSCS